MAASFVRPSRSSSMLRSARRARRSASWHCCAASSASCKKRSRAIYSNELQTAVSERYGILTVRHAKDGRALPATYVKVYALTGSGPKFYKNGYTDLRGKFDYASVSTSDIKDAAKFSVLVMSNDNGATVRRRLAA